MSSERFALESHASSRLQYVSGGSAGATHSDVKWNVDLRLTGTELVSVSLLADNLEHNCVDGKWRVEGEARVVITKCSEEQCVHNYRGGKECVEEEELFAGNAEKFVLSESHDKHTFGELVDWGHLERRFSRPVEWEYSSGVMLKVVVHVEVTSIARSLNAIDAVLVVEETEFPVSSKLLSLKSTFFASLFSGNFRESAKEPIPLKNANAGAFQLFLDVINRKCGATAETLVDLLELNDYLDSPFVRRHCELFLLCSADISRKERWRLVNKYVLRGVWHNLIMECRSLDDVASVVPGSIRQLHPEFMAALLEWMLKFDRRRAGGGLSDWMKD